MSDRSLISNLLHRRVPQFLGIYIAATWMAVEIGDWMIERFPVPEALTSYIFIGMIAMLPTVAVVAWGHGAPGKDEWTRFESGFTGLNALLAVAAMMRFAGAPMMPETPPEMAMLATETIEIVNDEGQTESYEVAREGFNQTLLAFFWKNNTGDEELDWLSYALPWSMSQDLNRNPLIRIQTPFWDRRIIERLRETGFALGVGEPRSLSLQIARERQIRQIVTGEFGRNEQGSLTFKTRLLDVETGALVSEFTQNLDDWLDAADALSGSIRDQLLEEVKTDSIVTELTIKEHTSDSEDAIQSLIEALRLRSFDNDYAGAAAAADRAIELDPTFAEAHVNAHMINRFAANMEKALDHAQKALALDYKLYSETKYALKANIYAIQGQISQALRTLELTRKIHPDSIDVYENLGRNYLLTSRIEEARESFEKLLELDPTRTDTLLSLATTYRLQQEPDKALELAGRFLEENPEDADAYMFVGRTHLQTGSFEDARIAFEEAAFRETDAVRGEVALALLTAREGYPDRAMNALLAISERDLPDRQQFEVQQALLRVYLNSGQVDNAIEALDRQQQAAASFVPPALRLVQLEGQRSALLAMTGDAEAALEAARAVKEQLSPPLSGLMGIPYLDIYYHLDMADEYRAEFKEIEQFAQRFDFPMLKDFMDMYRGRMERFDQRYEEATAAYDQTIKSFAQMVVTLDDPSTLEGVMLERARVLRESGKPDQAAIAASQLLNSNPGNTSMRLELAHSYFAQGFAEKAQAEINELKNLWRDADPEFIYLKRLADLEDQIASGN
ncbi:MAG: tetratricopeptide repeat protein [Xanthomonadales bacterium]|nr:tetratricopeptide repeat protein [Xanthomonadales bacterium]